MNTTQYTHVGARAATDKCTSSHTHTQTCARGARGHTHTLIHVCRPARTHINTHTDTYQGKGKTDYIVAGEGRVTKRAASGPFGTFCHHVVTKRAGVTKRACSASNLTRHVVLSP